MNRYITPTIAYVNADPHIGYAVELVQSDTLARSWRLRGNDVFFNTGADEHGQKIFEAAKKNGKEVQNYVDHYAEELRKLSPALGLSPTRFIRTTDNEHKKAAQEMWRVCEAAGDIYKKTYTGLYCVGCEAYKTEKELTHEGKCELHPSLTPEEISEENYFFRYSKYTNRLLEYLSREDRIVPDWRREEAIAFVKGGLEDFSISREKSRLSWGVPVPGDDSQVMYVWFDALTNYVSTLGWPEDKEGTFSKYWNEGYVVQTAGKDQIRFQSLMWQAMLMSAGMKNTDQVFYHGFINSGGQRMSKSLGNVINPYELVEKYGTDATRYLLLRHVHPFEDTDITWERLDEWYTADLVNGLGNLVARVMKLAEDHLPEPIAVPEAAPFSAELTNGLGRFEFNEALDYVWGKIAAADLRMTNEEPFKLIKTNPEKAKEIIRELVTELYWVGTLLHAFMPDTNEKIKKAVKENKKPENLFPRLG